MTDNKSATDIMVERIKARQGAAERARLKALANDPARKPEGTSRATQLQVAGMRTRASAARQREEEAVEAAWRKVDERLRAKGIDPDELD